MTGARQLLSQNRAVLADLPLPVRSGIEYAAVCGLLGGVVGLVLGLLAHPATAWAAALEVGVIAAVVGGAVGLVVGVVRWAVRRNRGRLTG